MSVYADGKALTLADTKHLVPNTKCSALQLAESIRTGNTQRIVNLIIQLLSQSEAPLQILATLTTQFRTWLWVKGALASSTILKDTELAHCCGIANPKRLYYLRQGVSGISIQFLIQTMSELFNLENCLKQGAPPNVMLPALVNMTKEFYSAGDINTKRNGLNSIFDL